MCIYCVLYLCVTHLSFHVHILRVFLCVQAVLRPGTRTADRLAAVAFVVNGKCAHDRTAHVSDSDSDSDSYWREGCTEALVHFITR
jgi:hypothetical protein